MMYRYVFMSVAAALLVVGCGGNPVRTDARHAMGLKGDVASVTETVYVAENEDGVVSKGRLADGGWSQVSYRFDGDGTLAGAEYYDQGGIVAWEEYDCEEGRIVSSVRRSVRYGADTRTEYEWNGNKDYVCRTYDEQGGLSGTVTVSGSRRGTECAVDGRADLSGVTGIDGLPCRILPPAVASDVSGDMSGCIVETVYGSGAPKRRTVSCNGSVMSDMSFDYGCKKAVMRGTVGSVAVEKVCEYTSRDDAGNWTACVWYVTENGGERLPVAVVEREITYYGKHV